MISTLSLILSVTFIVLSLMHFYWLAGGQWGLKQVIPTKNENETPQPPPKVATLIVALVLGSFGLIYLTKLEAIEISFPKWLLQYGYWIIPVLFIIRAIGEFKYVGFFKKMKNTEFAKADTKWFSPLCLFIGIAGVIIQILM